MSTNEIFIILDVDSSGLIKSFQITENISKEVNKLSKIEKNQEYKNELKCTGCLKDISICLYIPSGGAVETGFEVGVEVKQETSEWSTGSTLKSELVEVAAWPSSLSYPTAIDNTVESEDEQTDEDHTKYVPKKKNQTQKYHEAIKTKPKKIHFKEEEEKSDKEITKPVNNKNGPPGEFSCNICQKEFKNKLSLSTHKRYCTEERLNTTCKTCSKTYKTFYEYRTHMETAHGINPRHQCHECGRAFISPCKLEEHIMHKHDNIKHKCHTCLKEFTNKYVMMNHMKKEHAIDITARKSCTLCCPPQRFIGYNAYAEHLRDKHGIKIFPDDDENEGIEYNIKEEEKDAESSVAIKFPPKKKIKRDTEASKDFTCKRCSAVFKNKMSLSAHRRYCNPDMPRIGKPTCKYCGKVYSTWYTVKDHIRTEHEKIFLQCELCGKQLKNKSDLSEHLLKHKDPKPFVCHYCDKHFVNKDRVKIHILQKHLGQANYICEVCSKPFVMESEMNKHKSIVHSEVRPFPCAHCPKSFKTEFYLKNHIYSMHTPDELKPKFQCNVCDFVTTKPHYLEQHQRNHMDDSQKLPCSYCGKRFVDQSQKEKHEMIHTGERPFRCTACEQAFKTRVEMREHYIKAHTNDRPFLCEICRDAFADRWQYRNHLNKHEAELGVTLNKSVRHFMFKYKDL